MITSEIKVNGNLIGHIYCVNMGKLPASKNISGDDYRYNVSHYDVSEKLVKKFEVIHKRIDGYPVLMRKIWMEI